MIVLRGKKPKGHGATIDKMLQLLKREYPAKESVQVWMSDADTVEDFQYGAYHPGKMPTIIVATRNRTPNQIAGIIAQQYARHLQATLGKPDDQEQAAEFAKYLNNRMSGAVLSNPEKK